MKGFLSSRNLKKFGCLFKAPETVPTVLLFYKAKPLLTVYQIYMQTKPAVIFSLNLPHSGVLNSTKAAAWRIKLKLSSKQFNEIILINL